MDERDRALLTSIGHHASVARGYAKETGRAWYRDQKTLDAICKRLEQLGELAKRVSPETLTAIEGIDWRALKGMREVLVRGHEEVDVGIVREVVERRLPALIQALALWSG